MKIKPDLVLNLCFQSAKKSYGRKCMEIRTNEFPLSSGVYIVKYKDRSFPRFKGKSGVIKIGMTNNFRDRFERYNQKRAATSFKLISELRQWAKNSWTDWHFMWFTGKEVSSNKLIVELYFSNKPKILEQKFIIATLDTHLELPPLNLNLGKW